MEIAYRFRDVLYAPPTDEYGYSYGEGSVDVVLDEYRVISHTQKGYWIDNFGKKKFVLGTARKKFAHLNKKDAKESFIARKQKQYKIYSSRIQSVLKALKAVEKYK
jgi:hypothetical protein